MTTYGQAPYNYAQPGQPGTEADENAIYRQRSLGSLFENTNYLTRSIGGESTRALAEKLRTIFDAELEKVKSTTWKIAILDREQYEGLVYSVLVVSFAFKKSVNSVVLMMEGSGDASPPDFRDTMGGRETAYVRTPQEVSDRSLAALVRQELTNGWGSTHTQGTNTTMLVPKTFDVDDKEAVHGMAYNIIQACQFMARNDDSEREYYLINSHTAANQSGREVSLVTNIAFNYGDKNAIIGLDGMPYRADAQVDLLIQTNAPTSAQDVNNLNVIRYCTTYVHIDTLQHRLAPRPNQFNPMGMAGVPDQYARQIFAPRLTITDVSFDRVAAPETLMYGVLSTMALEFQSAWMQKHRKMQPRGDRIDLHDIGNIGLEGLPNENGVGSPIPTRVDSFGDNELYQIIATFFRDQPQYIIQSPLAGVNTWKFHPLNVEQENRTVHRGESFKAMLMTITNGRLAERVNIREAKAIRSVYYEFIGTYQNVDNRTRPLSDLDYLGVAAYAARANDQRLLQDWLATYLPDPRTTRERLTERRRIINAITGGSAEFKGIAVCTELDRELMVAAAQSLSDVGYRTSLHVPRKMADVHQNYLQERPYMPGPSQPFNNPVWDMSYNQPKPGSHDTFGYRYGV